MKNLLEEAAADMVKTSELNEREVTLRKMKLFLVRSGTERSEEMNKIQGSFLGITITSGEETFLVFRTNKSK
jgi:hypothetical protein